ncbi:elongation factor P 5-aminopentanone reductase [Alkalibacillus haloalkaliphilus]|uniref:3-ketoacyl-ACP reductase n=1 Tax=Alkalibacillus haloalkaliphilus TaxID=94136 RepID=A0A511W2I9_9BACI|nr:SDR family oxidoreductase [Alkalibacillus haloalkaliphilus]GEN44981.1 3-ketoacyl-ACP reductase [Alkalibacillus haloalkaliphilus]
MKNEEIVLVIGSSGEIGKATVQALAEQSNRRFILHYSKNSHVIDELVEILHDDQVLMSVQADLTQPDEIYSLIDLTPFDVDTIVFAQGQALSQTFIKLDEQTMDALYNVHVKATTLITQAFLASMVKKQEGNIVVISSIWGEEGASFEVWYSMMKSAQINFVKSLAKEMGPSGIKVNGVTPGFINTKMNQALTDEEIGYWIEDVPLSRLGEASEVANCVKFLCSSQSSYVNGHILKVNGGIS